MGGAPLFATVGLLVLASAPGAVTHGGSGALGAGVIAVLGLLGARRLWADAPAASSERARDFRGALWLYATALALASCAAALAATVVPAQSSNTVEGGVAVAALLLAVGAAGWRAPPALARVLGGLGVLAATGLVVLLFTRYRPALLGAGEAQDLRALGGGAFFGLALLPLRRGRAPVLDLLIAGGLGLAMGAALLGAAGDTLPAGHAEVLPRVLRTQFGDAATWALWAAVPLLGWVLVAVAAELRRAGLRTCFAAALLALPGAFFAAEVWPVVLCAGGLWLGLLVDAAWGLRQGRGIPAAAAALCALVMLIGLGPGPAVGAFVVAGILTPLMGRLGGGALL